MCIEAAMAFLFVGMTPLDWRIWRAQRLCANAGKRAVGGSSHWSATSRNPLLRMFYFRIEGRRSSRGGVLIVRQKRPFAHDRSSALNNAGQSSNSGLETLDSWDWSSGNSQADCIIAVRQQVRVALPRER